MLDVKVIVRQTNKTQK